MYKLGEVAIDRTPEIGVELRVQLPSGRPAQFRESGREDLVGVILQCETALTADGGTLTGEEISDAHARRLPEALCQRLTIPLVQSLRDHWCSSWHTAGACR